MFDIDTRQLIWLITVIILMTAFIHQINQMPESPKLPTKSKETYDNFVQDGEISLQDGYYTIRGSRNNLYCSDDANGLICNRDMSGPHETFYVQKLDKGEYAIRSMKNNLWCSQTNTGMRCLASVVGNWEVFRIIHEGNGKYAIQNVKNNMYCQDNGTGLSCDTSLKYKKEFELFEFIPIRRVSIK